MTLEVSSVCRLVPSKGHDRVLAVTIKGHHGAYLAAVADGLTSENGGSAAEWAVTALSQVASSEAWVRPPDARQVYEHLSRQLTLDARREQLPDSHTTLTCGIVHQVSESSFEFDFFAIGDSPVWKLIRPLGSSLDFQAFVVYGGPVPGEQGRVYSTLNLRHGSVDGAVYWGTVVVEESEVLVLTSDGVPDARVLWDDQDPRRGKSSPKLGRRLMEDKPLDDSELGSIVAAYDKNELLVDDDASLVVVRLVLKSGGSVDPESRDLIGDEQTPDQSDVAVPRESLVGEDCATTDPMNQESPNSQKVEPPPVEFEGKLACSSAHDASLTPECDTTQLKQDDEMPSGSSGGGAPS